MIRELRFINVQGHVDTHLKNLPPTGFIRISGGNGHGKSGMSRGIDDIIRCKLHQKEIRKSLIQWGKPYAEVVIETHSNKRILAHITIDAASTYVEYTNLDTGDKLRRSVSDKSYYKLVDMLGFHYSKERDFSLHMYNTFDPLLFVNTPRPFNYDIFSECLTDVFVENAIEKMSIILEQMKANIDNHKTVRASAEIKLSSIVRYDIEKESKVSETAQSLYDDIKALSNVIHYLPMKDLTVCRVPNIDTREIELLSELRTNLQDMKPLKPEPKLDKNNINLLSELKPLSTKNLKGRFKLDPNVVYLNRLLTLKLDDGVRRAGLRLNDDLNEMTEVMNRKCPTCGRNFT